MDTERFARAVAEIDKANADDPNSIAVRGELQPKELAHAQLATEWMRRLERDPSEALLLAARAHHIRRWVTPRSSYPEGRAGYLRWRRGLHRFHADEVATILAGVGYETAMIERVQRIVAKRDLAKDREVQVLEDALCLVFVETQLHELTLRLDRTKMLEVVGKALAKMSDDGIALALTIDISDDDRALILEAAAAADDYSDGETGR